MKSMYQDDVRKCYNPLSPSEQLVMYSKLRSGDIQAREDIICSCLPLVMDLAIKFRYNNKHIDLDDMIQEGNMALMKAVDRWDINKGSITTVATWYVRNSLIDMITDARYNIKHPYTMSRRAAEELRKIKNIDSTNIEYISKETGLTPKRVKKLLSVSPRGTTRVKVNTLEPLLNYDELDSEESVQKPCMADLVSLINDNLRGDQKKIFCLWAGVHSKKIGPKEIAISLGKTEQYVYDNIYGAKRILSRAAKR